MRMFSVAMLMAHSLPLGWALLSLLVFEAWGYAAWVQTLEGDSWGGAVCVGLLFMPTLVPFGTALNEEIGDPAKGAKRALLSRRSLVRSCAHALSAVLATALLHATEENTEILPAAQRGALCWTVVLVCIALMTLARCLLLLAYKHKESAWPHTTADYQRKWFDVDYERKWFDVDYEEEALALPRPGDNAVDAEAAGGHAGGEGGTATEAQEQGCVFISPELQQVCTARVEFYVSRILASKKYNNGWIPDVLEQLIYGSCAQLAVDSILWGVAQLNGITFFGHAIQVRVGKLPDVIQDDGNILRPGDTEGSEQIDAFVQQLLLNRRINSPVIPDLVEHAIYVNALKIILRVVDDVLAALNLRILGHRLTLGLQPSEYYLHQCFERLRSGQSESTANNVDEAALLALVQSNAFGFPQLPGIPDFVETALWSNLVFMLFNVVAESLKACSVDITGVQTQLSLVPASEVATNVGFVAQFIPYLEQAYGEYQQQHAAGEVQPAVPTHLKS